MTFINTKGQGHLLTFVLDASDSVFLTLSLKLLGILKTNLLNIKPLWDWEIKVCSSDLVHMTKIAIMPIYMYGKKDLNSSSQELKDS